MVLSRCGFDMYLFTISCHGGICHGYVCVVKEVIETIKSEFKEATYPVCKL